MTKAVELMTLAGVWTSGTPVEPSAFGLSSLSVRAIVTAMTGQLGIQACDSKNPTELLRSCAIQITAILAKSTAGASASANLSAGVKGGAAATGGVSSVIVSGSAVTSSSSGGVTAGGGAIDYSAVYSLLMDSTKHGNHDGLLTALGDLGKLRKPFLPLMLSDVNLSSPFCLGTRSDGAKHSLH